MQVVCQRRIYLRAGFMRLKPRELRVQSAGWKFGSKSQFYKISQMKMPCSTFFGINRPCRIATSQNLIESQAPIERRMADAIDSLKLLTSPALSASTITRAKVSVPE